MKKLIIKILSCLTVTTVAVIGLTSSTFAGASTGNYYGAIPIGAYYVDCSLNINPSSATATAAMQEFGFVTLSVSIVGDYRDPISGEIHNTTNGNFREWYDVSTSIYNAGGSWVSVSASYSASGGNFSGSLVLP